VLRSRLPTIGWEYASGGSPARWNDVEAMLLGSVEREMVGVDARELPQLRFVQRVYTGMDGVPFERFPRGSGSRETSGPTLRSLPNTRWLSLWRRLASFPALMPWSPPGNCDPRRSSGYCGSAPR